MINAPTSREDGRQDARIRASVCGVEVRDSAPNGAAVVRVLSLMENITWRVVTSRESRRV